jgi:hypothetical protein
MPDGPRGVARIVTAIQPFDRTERDHQAAVLTWLAPSFALPGQDPRGLPR